MVFGAGAHGTDPASCVAMNEALNFAVTSDVLDVCEPVTMHTAFTCGVNSTCKPVCYCL